jgi:GNAT superfamily N-acetyltransferase
MICIRRAHPGERDAVVRVRLAAFEEYRPSSQDATRAFERWTRTMVEGPEQGEIFVALEDDGVAEMRIVGTGALLLPPEQPDYGIARSSTLLPAEWAKLRLLSVDPAYRGRGIARMLTEARIRRSREACVPVVALHTSEPFVVARGMHERAGFRRAPDYDFFVAGTRAEAWIYTLKSERSPRVG